MDWVAILMLTPVCMIAMGLCVYGMRRIGVWLFLRVAGTIVIGAGAFHLFVMGMVRLLGDG